MDGQIVPGRPVDSILGSAVWTEGGVEGQCGQIVPGRPVDSILGRAARKEGWTGWRGSVDTGQR